MLFWVCPCCFEFVHVLLFCFEFIHALLFCFELVYALLFFFEFVHALLFCFEFVHLTPCTFVLSKLKKSSFAQFLHYLFPILGMLQCIPFCQQHPDFPCVFCVWLHRWLGWWGEQTSSAVSSFFSLSWPTSEPALMVNTCCAQ